MGKRENGEKEKWGKREIRFAEFPAVSLLFRSGWLGGDGWVAGEVGTKTYLSPARASLLGLSLAIPKVVVYLSCSDGRTHFARTKNQE